MEKQLVKTAVTQMNDLYILWRGTHLQQFSSGYITQKRKLTDYVVEEHLKGNRTIGVKLGAQGLTKFLTFDVDYSGELDKAKEVTETIVCHLINYYGIPVEDIHVSFSGGKGYHVTLFFDGVIQDIALIPFYEEALRDLNLSNKKVEFRCSKQYGMKLPLSIHRKTNKFMNYCIYNVTSGLLTHLNKEDSFKYFVGIERQSLIDFRELILDELDVVEKISGKPLIMKEKDAKEFEQVMSEINLDGKSIEDLNDEIRIILNNGRLTYEGTRHRITFLLSVFFKEQGYPEEDTLGLVSNVLMNTYNNKETRQLISAETTEEYMLREVRRLTKLAYERDYKFTTRRKDVWLNKEEILEVLDVKEYHLKKLLFTLLIHSKRYAKKDGTFYMAYSTMTHMGNTTDRGRLLKHIVSLEQIKKAQIISRDELDEIRTRVEGFPVKKPNVYKVTLDSSDCESDEKIKLQSNSEMTLEAVTAMLIDESSARKIIPKKQYYKYFKPLYA